MKRKILILLLALQPCLSYGQNSPCVNNVSTNPDDPTNSNLPLDTVSNTAFDLLFLNNFDWIPFGSQNNLMDLETTGLPALGTDQEMRPLYNNGSFYGYINSELMMPSATEPGVIPNHQHGWELIGVNLGFFPDNITPYTDVQDISNQHPRMPYVILYNRYLSKIRVFVNIHDEWSIGMNYSAARIRLTLNTDNERDLNGLFRLQEGLDRSLDQPTNVRSAGALVGAPNDKQRWLIGDFTVAFDPCVCDFPSAFNLDVELIKNIDFQLYGRGISTEEEIVDGNGEFVNSNFLSSMSVDFDNPDINEGGFVMYKKMEDLFDDYITRMDHYDSTLAAVSQHNAKVDRNLAIIKWVKHAIDVGVAAATGGSSIAVPLIDSLIVHAPDLFGLDTTATGLSDNWEKAFKAAEKIIGTEVMTYVNDNFKKQDAPSSPSKPTANFSEMYFEGRLTQVDPKTGPMIYTPGTYGNSINTFLPDQHAYPVYNEPLGVFALLKKPKIEIAKYIKGVSCEISENPIYSDPGSVPGSEIYFHESRSEYEQVTQFKLLEKLDYFFNPVLDIKDYSIQTSFLVNGQVNNLNSDYVATNSEESVNIESISFNADELDTLEHLDTVEFNSIYTPIDALNNFVFSAGVKKTTPDMITLNDYCEQFEIDISKLKNNLSAEQNQALKIEDIYLKLLINVTYEGEKSDGSPHEYTYMFTYKIDDNDITYDYNNPLYPNLPGSSGDISQYPENLFLDSETFDGSPVEGCELNGNVYTCKARNDVELSGNFTVANNYDVFIEGGNEVRVLPDAVTPPEMVWQIEPVFDYSNPMPPVDKTYVSEFCQNEDTYKAREGTKIVQKDSTSESRTPEQSETFSFVLYPNPTNGTTTARIELESAAESELYITDINGRKLASAFKDQPLRAGVTEHQIPTETLNSGVYLVHLFIDGKHHVKRLVKQ